MIEIPRQVFYKGFDWYGLRVLFKDASCHISSGRIGTHTNPLCIKDGVVSGGWYIPETSLQISDEISRVDILVRDTQAYVMFRSSDNTERYPDTFTLLLSLAWREDSDWYVLVPQRDGTYEEDFHR